MMTFETNLPQKLKATDFVPSLGGVVRAYGSAVILGDDDASAQIPVDYVGHITVTTGALEAVIDGEMTIAGPGYVISLAQIARNSLRNAIDGRTTFVLSPAPGCGAVC